MNNATRRALIERKKQSGFPGSIIDVFRAYDQGVDLIGQFQQQQAQQMQVASTPQQQQQGLRPAHQAGNTNASMAFPNQPPNASFNTVGMKAPINLKQYDPRGNLVKSYEAVPPGVKDLKMSSQGGTVIETPAQMQSGGVRKAQDGLPPFSLQEQPIQAESTFRPNFGEQAFLNQVNATPQIVPTAQQVLSANVAANQGTISPMSKGVEENSEPMPVYRMLAEPMKALKYWGSDYNRERGMPTQAEWDAYGNTNPYDLVTSMYNPAQIAVDSEQGMGMAGVGAIGGLATADDLLRSADTFKRFGINNSYEAGQLTRNIGLGQTEGIASELVDAGSIINQGADNARLFFENARPGFSPSAEGRYYLDRLADNTLAHHPQLAATYNPGMINSDAAIAAADDFAQKYLTSYRGVRADNAEQAAEYLTSPFGRGNRAFGEGIYSTYNPNVAKQHGNFVGELIADPQFTLGNDPRYTMGRLDFLRTQGGQPSTTMSERLGSETFDKIGSIIDLGRGLSEEVGFAVGGRSGADFLMQQLHHAPDFRTGFLDEAGQRVQRGTGPDRLKPKLVQLTPSQDFNPTVNAIWGERMNMGTQLSPEFKYPTQMFFRERGFQKYGGVRKYQSGDFVYGDWREVSREVDPLTNDTIITEQRDGSRTLEYNKRGVNWDVGYRRWLAQGNTGTLAEFKARAEAWKRSQAKTEYDTQTRTNRLSNEEDRIFADLFPISPLGPSPIPTSEYEHYPSDVSSEVLNATANGPGAYGRPGSSGASGSFSGSGNRYPFTSYQSNVGEVLNETPVEDGSNNVGSTSSPFNVQSTYNLESRQNRAGKTRSVYTDDINVTRADGTSTNTRTRQVDVTRPGQEDRTRGKSIFEEFDADGNRIVRQVDKLKKGGRVRKYQTRNALPRGYRKGGMSKYFRYA